MIINLFSGAGGWDVALRNLGREAVGIDNNKDACATRVAAGFHPTIINDISTIDPASYPIAYGGVQCEGLIASPPCQSFSLAGKRKGLDDPRGKLIFEVMRWARILKPKWIACENVPAALPIWGRFCEELRSLGYFADAKILHAEQYGVPQTRSRAILIATRFGAYPFIHFPEPTHSRYYPRDPKKLDLGVLPWISWGEALSMRDAEHVNNNTAHACVHADDKPAGTIYFGERMNYQGFRLHHTRGAGMTDRHGTRPDRPEKSPAFNVTSKARSWTWESPSTTIVGSFGRGRMAFRGAHGKSTYEDERSTRITIQEASLLQTFPADYPWQGSRSSQFQQVGNAIPPLFAEAILRSVIC
jgi:DNA (cytosine-5)-methyltransferase 1